MEIIPTDIIEPPIDVIIKSIESGEIICKNELTNEQYNKLPSNIKKLLINCTDTQLNNLLEQVLNT